ncbi:MAG TPA: YkgJ family cysteine cluster protein [Gammaproteobacteria bacterium]|nr:YkgJ family cysteine cluster protein [Gammaproteobacteria bacterium]
MRPYYQQQSLRFSCTRCGRCCTGGAGYHVYFTRGEANAACASLGLTWKWFRRHYLRRLEGDGLVAADRGGACIFLNAAGQCRIYAQRPVQCRTYPFWPELVDSEASWRREALRCEGINRGKVVSLARIRKALRACLEVPD